jgi:carbon-monoxide dehydrogenase medium subunit
MMKLRIASPKYLVDLCDIKELISIEGDSQRRVRIGSMVTYHGAQNAPALNAYGAISDALSVIADEQVRHVGTLGGSCCQADPHGDMPNVVVALDAQMEALGTKGKRIIPARQFFVGPLETALESDEILINIYFPAQGARTGSAYEKFAWRKGDYAIVSACATLVLGTNGECSQASIVIGSARSSPLLLQQASSAVIGKRITEQLLRNTADTAFDEVEPEDDPIYGSAEYKRELVRTLTHRSVVSAWKRSQHSGD